MSFSQAQIDHALETMLKAGEVEMHLVDAQGGTHH
jgi:hypothetical protein